MSKKMYICDEQVGWQFGSSRFIKPGEKVELTEEEFQNYTKSGVKLKDPDVLNEAAPVGNKKEK